jgi:mono/diheme cytochrome c family protein
MIMVGGVVIWFAALDRTSRAAEPGVGEKAAVRGHLFPDRELFRQGRFVYQKNCMVCHGRFGEGNGELVRDWDVQPRNFQKAQFKYRSTPYGKLPTNDDLKRTIRHGVSGSAMPVFKQLQDGEVEAVIEYIKFFSPMWKDGKNYDEPVELPPVPDWFADEKELRIQAAYGRILFRDTCAPCHGNEGAGDGVAAAGLQDIEGTAIRPADLRLPLRSGAEPADVYRTIMTGISGTPMMGFDGLIKPSEVWQIVAYISELKSDPRAVELDVDQGK